MLKILRSAALAVFAFGSVAQAATVTLTYNGGTASGSAKITASPVTPVGGFGTYGAWGFKMTDSTKTLGDADGKFIAWCLDVSQWLSGGTFDITTAPFTDTFFISTARVQRVFNANYAGLNTSNSTQAAAFQVALWNAIYDKDWSAAGGDFTVASGLVQDQANAYLAAAKNLGGPHRYNLTFLQHTGAGQNLVTATPTTPVPLPAGLPLLLAGLGALALVRRRKA